MRDRGSASVIPMGLGRWVVLASFIRNVFSVELRAEQIVQLITKLLVRAVLSLSVLRSNLM